MSSSAQPSITAASPRAHPRPRQNPLYGNAKRGRATSYGARSSVTPTPIKHLSTSGYDPAEDVALQPYGYTGRRYDNETDLWYFRARFFDAELGRFISRDPLGYVDGMSMYRGYFVPGLVDPSGMIVCEEITGMPGADFDAPGPMFDLTHNGPDGSLGYWGIDRDHGFGNNIRGTGTVYVVIQAGSARWQKENEFPFDCCGEKPYCRQTFELREYRAGYTQVQTYGLNPLAKGLAELASNVAGKGKGAGKTGKAVGRIGTIVGLVDGMASLMSRTAYITSVKKVVCREGPIRCSCDQNYLDGLDVDEGYMTFEEAYMSPRH